VRYLTGGSIYSAPAVGDIDADGTYEIIVGSIDDDIYCISHTGIFEWSYTTGNNVIAASIVTFSIALALAVAVIRRKRLA